ncbi:MAG: hypothetical protein FWC93_08310 [Defluviitaleaceae bacterium]|nr:hypothetical protein [Defluviitaleaceae bacterium]
MGLDYGVVIKNLKTGIVKDLHKNRLVTQKQMELAIARVNQGFNGGLNQSIGQPGCVETKANTGKQVIYEKKGNGILQGFYR